MSPLQILKNHYEGKTIVGGQLHPQYIGYQIHHVGIDSYEPMLSLSLKKDFEIINITVLFERNIEVA